MPRSRSRSKCPFAYIKGKAYDLTSFEKRHPGGADLLKLAYGNDATPLIYSYHPHPEKIFRLLNQYKVNSESQTTSLSGSDTVTQTPSSMRFDSAFFKTLKDRVNQYFKLTKKNRRGGLAIRSTVLLLITCLSYLLSLKVTWLAGPVFGVCLAMIGLCIHHDANHGSYSTHPKVNHFLGLFGDVIGTSSLIWRYQHCLNHHTHCNDVQQDEDTKAGLPWFRFHFSQRHYWYMKYQHFYTPFLYALMGAFSPFFSIYEFFTRKHGKVILQRVDRKDWVDFWLLKMVYFTYMMIIPFYVLGYAFLWRFYLPVQLAGGFYLASLFALNHNNHKVYQSSKIKSDDWAVQQIITSANWSSRSRFWNVMSGGLNCQIEHHLFPGICHIHYPALHPIVKQTCQEFSIPYNDYNYFTQLFIDHLRYLKKMAQVEIIQ